MVNHRLKYGSNLVQTSRLVLPIGIIQPCGLRQIKTVLYSIVSSRSGQHKKHLEFSGQGVLKNLPSNANLLAHQVQHSRHIGCLIYHQSISRLIGDCYMVYPSFQCGKIKKGYRICSVSLDFTGDPGRNRTCDTRIRNPLNIQSYCIDINVF